MHDVNQQFRQFEDAGGGKNFRPRRGVDVASYRSDGSNLLQGRQNRGIANIAGMNDVIRAGESRECFRPKQAMRVGDDADCDQELRFQ